MRQRVEREREGTEPMAQTARADAGRGGDDGRYKRLQNRWLNLHRANQLLQRAHEKLSRRYKRLRRHAWNLTAERDGLRARLEPAAETETAGNGPDRPAGGDGTAAGAIQIVTVYERKDSEPGACFADDLPDESYDYTYTGWLPLALERPREGRPLTIRAAGDAWATRKPAGANADDAVKEIDDRGGAGMTEYWSSNYEGDEWTPETAARVHGTTSGMLARRIAAASKRAAGTRDLRGTALDEAIERYRHHRNAGDGWSPPRGGTEAGGRPKGQEDLERLRNAAAAAADAATARDWLAGEETRAIELDGNVSLKRAGGPGGFGTASTDQPVLRRTLVRYARVPRGRVAGGLHDLRRIRAGGPPRVAEEGAAGRAGDARRADRDETGGGGDRTPRGGVGTDAGGRGRGPVDGHPGARRGAHTPRNGANGGPGLRAGRRGPSCAAGPPAGGVGAQWGPGEWDPAVRRTATSGETAAEPPEGTRGSAGHEAGPTQGAGSRRTAGHPAENGRRAVDEVPGPRSRAHTGRNGANSEPGPRGRSTGTQLCCRPARGRGWRTMGTRARGPRGPAETAAAREAARRLGSRPAGGDQHVPSIQPVRNQGAVVDEYRDFHVAAGELGDLCDALPDPGRESLTTAVGVDAIRHSALRVAEAAASAARAIRESDSYPRECGHARTTFIPPLTCELRHDHSCAHRMAGPEHGQWWVWHTDDDTPVLVGPKPTGRAGPRTTAGGSGRSATPA